MLTNHTKQAHSHGLHVLQELSKECPQNIDVTNIIFKVLIIYTS